MVRGRSASGMDTELSRFVLKDHMLFVPVLLIPPKVLFKAEKSFGNQCSVLGTEMPQTGSTDANTDLELAPYLRLRVAGGTFLFK